MTAFMGKKRRRKAIELYEKLRDGDAGIYDITLALYEAAKCGRRKEREKWAECRQEEIHYVPVVHYSGRCCIEPKPPFDAEEVRGLIDALRDFAIDVGLGKHAEWCMNEAKRRLLTALGIDGGE